MNKILLHTSYFILLTLTACGFKPVYSSNSGSSNTQLASIEITPLEGRVGQVLHNNLEDLLNPANISANPEYSLEIELDSETREFGIENNLRVTRYEILLDAKYRLISNNDGEILINDTERVYSSYNRTTSEFSTFVANEDSYEKAAEQMAYEIRSRIAAYFSK